jgi:hypothetical protein
MRSSMSGCGLAKGNGKVQSIRVMRVRRRDCWEVTIIRRHLCQQAVRWGIWPERLVKSDTPLDTGDQPPDEESDGDCKTDEAKKF